MVVPSERAGESQTVAAIITAAAASHHLLSAARRTSIATAAAGRASRNTLDPVASIAPRCNTTGPHLTNARSTPAPRRSAAAITMSGSVPAHQAATKSGLPRVPYTRMRGFENVSGIQPHQAFTDPAKARRGKTAINAITDIVLRFVFTRISLSLDTMPLILLSSDT